LFLVTAGSANEFEAHRARLFGLAYRLLGSAEEAKDVVQDAFLRWNDAERAAIRTPSAWLAKVATNLCLNRLTSARARRERYVGPWLPEPVLTADPALEPSATAEQRDTISLALLVLLERLTPTERAVFVLREAFGYSHRDVAEIVDLTEVNCRQLHRRARRQLSMPSHGDGAAQVDHTQWHHLVERFLAAAREGNLRELEQLLAAEVTSWADGGGQVSTARRPVVGRVRVARYLAGSMNKAAAGARFSLAEVNGEPAALAWVGSNLLALLVLEITDGWITALRIVANPDKLRFAARQAARLSHPAGLPGSW
jgi:RNA polymerase sigma-70 factor (TIGR02957 family)